MNPGRNVSVGFTYITGVTASTEKRINCIGLWTNLPYTNNNNAKTFHKRPLRSSLRKRNHEKPQIGYRTEQLKKQIQK